MKKKNPMMNGLCVDCTGSWLLNVKEFILAKYTSYTCTCIWHIHVHVYDIQTCQALNTVK